MVLVVKNLPADTGDARDAGSIPGSRRSPGVRNGTPLQYPCLEISVGKGAWQAIGHRATELDTTEQLSTQTHTYVFVYVFVRVCVCTQYCPSLCDHMDYSQPGSSVHGISQARILKWVAISFSRGSS